MAGLLDSKTRVIDGKLTSRGRMSLTDGGFEVKYVSFSDSGANYEDNGSGVAVEPLRIGFETFSTSNDEITITTDNFGSLNAFAGADSFLNADGTTTQTVGNLTGSNSTLAIIASGSLESFKNQRLISTKNVLLDDPGLSTSPSQASFIVSDTVPFNGEPSVSSIDDIESLFADRRLSKSIRFQYLPPIQRTITSVGNEALLGEYVDVREDPLTEQEIEDQIYSSQNQKFTFSKLTKFNEVCMQFFESSSSGLEKLDIIKYGELQQRTESGAQRNLYFVGKVYDDSFGNATFVNLFDVVLE
jgi:hypothetical protein